MKILEELPGAYSSKVELVEILDKKYVLKTWDAEETANEKEFLKTLKANNLPALEVYENSELAANQILLEYIEGSPKLPEIPESYYQVGEILCKMHKIRYPQSFKVGADGEKEIMDWNEFLKSMLEEGIQRQKTRKSDMDDELIQMAKDYIYAQLPLKVSNFSLLHADVHLDNILEKNGNLLIYDKNPEIFSGDRIYDLATFFTYRPNGSYIDIKDPENKSDKMLISSLRDGYGEDFLTLEKSRLDVYVVIKGLLRYPNPWEPHIKEIIRSIVSS